MTAPFGGSGSVAPVPTPPDVNPRGAIHTDLDRGKIRMRSQPAISVALVVGTAALAGAILATSAALFAVALAALGLVITDAVLAREPVADPQISLRPPVVGEPFADLTFVSQARLPGRPIQIELAEPWGRRFYLIDQESPGLVVTTIAFRGRRTHHVMEVVGFGPLGFFEARRLVRCRFDTPLPIGPAAVPHDLDWPTDQWGWTGEALPSRLGHELVRGVRPYRQGDACRQVHWRATARHGSLMVKETDGYAALVVRIVVSIEHPGPAADAALGRARFVAAEAIAQGHMVQLVTVEADGDPATVPVDVEGLMPQPLVPSAESRTVVGLVRSDADVLGRLAGATYGRPRVGSFHGACRRITEEGDEWM